MFQNFNNSKSQNINQMKSTRDTNQCSQSKTLKKIQGMQEFLSPCQCFTPKAGKRVKEYHLPKYSKQGDRNLVAPKRPRSQRINEERELVERKEIAINESIFQSRGNLPFARPEKNISGHLLILDPRRKIFPVPKEANYVNNHCKNSGLITHSSKQRQKNSNNKQVYGIRKARHSSSPFLEELDLYIDHLDCQENKSHKNEYPCEDYSENQNSNLMYFSIQHHPVNRDIRRDKILHKLMEQRKEKKMIAYKLEMRDKKIKKMNQTAAHLLEYIQQLKDEIASTRQEKEQHLQMLSEFVEKYQNVRKNTPQLQHIYEEHQYRILYDVDAQMQKLQPFYDKVSDNQDTGKLKKRGMGNRNLNNQLYFKGRGSNRGSATDICSYT